MSDCIKNNSISAGNLSHPTHNEVLIQCLEDALKLNQNPSVASKLEKCYSMICGLENYLEQTCGKETQLQKEIVSNTISEPWEQNFEKRSTTRPFGKDMLSTRHSTQFLKLMVEITKAERVLEIGMFTGYSAAIFCAAECVKQVTALEIDPFVVNFVKSHFSGKLEEKKLRILEGPALESLSLLKDAREDFDAIFIDADKPNYLNYYKFVMDNALVKPGGIILIDNVLWMGEVYPHPNYQTEQGKLFYDFNEFVSKDTRVSQVILQICDGITLVQVK